MMMMQYESHADNASETMLESSSSDSYYYSSPPTIVHEATEDPIFAPQQVWTVRGYPDARVAIHFSEFVRSTYHRMNVVHCMVYFAGVEQNELHDPASPSAGRCVFHHVPFERSVLMSSLQHVVAYLAPPDVSSCYEEWKAAVANRVGDCYRITVAEFCRTQATKVIASTYLDEAVYAAGQVWAVSVRPGKAAKGPAYEASVNRVDKSLSTRDIIVHVAVRNAENHEMVVEHIALTRSAAALSLKGGPLPGAEPFHNTTTDESYLTWLYSYNNNLDGAFSIPIPQVIAGLRLPSK